ncbi:flagellar basal-body rod protein FlgG [bacterium]|nr:flagellar basal-body rod protein FlgG [bacterium]
MLRGLNSGATGMEAQQTKLDVTSNNLANVSTTGFKKNRADFQDLLYQTFKAPGTSSADGVENPTGVQIGAGVKTVDTQKIFTAGDMLLTNNALDVAIEGDGFLQIQLPTGDIGYTRDGSLHRNSQGVIVNADGYPLVPNIIIPQDALSVNIGNDGTVSVTQPGQTAANVIGNIQLATFINPAGLSANGRNIFLPSNASGDAIVGVPGENGMGTLTQGFLESSNVKVVEEMINLITTQRAYEFNSKSVQTADQMLRTTSSLK